MKRQLIRILFKKQILCNWDHIHLHLSGVSKSGCNIRKHTNAKIIRDFYGQICNIEYRTSVTLLADLNSCNQNREIYFINRPICVVRL